VNVSVLEGERGLCHRNLVLNAKLHMATEIETFRERLIRYLLRVLDGRRETFQSILARSQNCDPAFLMDTLHEMEVRGLLQAAREEDSTGYSRARHPEASDHTRPVPPEPMQHRDSGHDDRGILGSNYFRELVRAVLRSLPKPSLVYSQWWFSEPTYSKLVAFLLGLQRQNKDYHIAFLGSSTLGTVLSQCVSAPVAIIDVDDVLLERIKTCVGGTAQRIQRDISDPLDASLKGQFDVVVADPPWSSSTLRTFFVRSAQMLSVDGTLVISLPPVFTRPSAAADRTSFLDLARVLGLSLRTRLMSFTEYDVPAFECNAYKEHGIGLKEPWRKGDIFVFRKQRKSAGYEDIPVEASWKWDQYDYATVRLFLKSNGSTQEGPARIMSVPGKNNFLYDSTSSRTQLWEHACLVSTRNQIAEISGRKQLEAILQELQATKHDLSNGLRCVSRVDPDTQTALLALFSDFDGKNSERRGSK
jgi:hypothetical protein